MIEKSREIVFIHEELKLGYVETLKGLWHAFLCPISSQENFHKSQPKPNFHLSIAGKPHGFCSSMVTGYTNLPLEMEMEKVLHTDEKIQFIYRHHDLALIVNVEFQLIKGANVLRQVTTVTNQGNEPIVLNHLSSMCMNGIAMDGVRPWHDKNKIRVHYCRQTWQGEGQWRFNDLEELGLYPTSSHPNSGAIHFSSVGSFSTSRYLPMAVIEDVETSQTWYFQIETSGNWHFEIGHYGSWEDSKGALFIHADGANERHGGWFKELLPGESYSSVPVAVGCCTGDFTDGIKELTKYRRYHLKPEEPWQEYCPVIFNDYMNCLWGNPTRDTLIPLIGSAAKVGVECFCIDAGWFGGLTDSWGKGLGDWNPSKDRFGDDGLKGILQYIKDKGMIAGLWIEMEVCGEDANLGNKPDSWFLMRNGKRVGGGSRWFLNIENREVREYLHDTLDSLIALGVGYFKNDYNDCIGNGSDTNGSSAEGLLSNINAFYSFIDEVREKHPSLIIENCASGAMRQDYGILKHFHLQSTSDQEIYHKYPSILSGCLAGLLTEQAGIWAYPYPLLFNEKGKPEILRSQEYQKSMADGEQTIFNMISGMCGVLYLSGHIENADEKNRGLIKEAINLYKHERSFIHKAYPFWPIGFTKINVRNTWVCVGLSSMEETRALLAVWRLGSDQEFLEIPLNRFTGRVTKIRQIYPAENFNTDFYLNVYKNSMTVNFKGTYQGRFFEIILG